MNDNLIRDLVKRLETAQGRLDKALEDTSPSVSSGT